METIERIKLLLVDYKSAYSFRFLAEEDLEWARALHNDPNVLKMLTDPRQVSLEGQVHWFQGLQKSVSSCRLVVEKHGEKIGLVRIDQIDPWNFNLCLGMDIVSEHRGQGHARPIYLSLFDFIFDGMGFNRIWLLVAEYNEVARHLYTRLGFKEEGCHRKALYKEGSYFDYILMGVLREEYRGNQDKQDYI